MRTLDFYRYRRMRRVATIVMMFGATCPILWGVIRWLCAPPSAGPPSFWLQWIWLGFGFLCVLVFMVEPRLRISQTRARERRAWYQRMYPHECVRCGYDIRHCPGPNCPECGEPLGENQGRRLPAGPCEPTA